MRKNNCHAEPNSASIKKCGFDRRQRESSADGHNHRTSNDNHHASGSL